mmetsp:Transcript_55288/g.131860  ORF Transcript_55288/g.131860 Transcript_55288/m.131860 type:complete len:349 (-) Transcript_55288:104-1150(-)
MDGFGDLQLQLESGSVRNTTGGVVDEWSWAVGEEGSLRHKSGITIGKHGLEDPRWNSLTGLNAEDIDVDTTQLLGRGAGGVVTRAKHRPTGIDLAVKVVRVEEKAKRSQLINDLRTLLWISKSSFLIRLYAAYVHAGTGCVHVVLEYMDYGSLAIVKQRARTVPENLLALIVMQILEGLKTLHLSFIVHRDVKLGNILVNSAGAVKVTDFGISKAVDPGRIVCDTFVGTATHLSPERVKGEGYSFPADIWGLGLCVYELASGKYPYVSIDSFPALFDNLLHQAEPRLPEAQYSKDLCHFVESCLKRDPERRHSAIQLQAHAYIIENMFKVTQAELVSWLHMVMNKDGC